MTTATVQTTPAACPRCQNRARVFRRPRRWSTIAGLVCLACADLIDSPDRDAEIAAWKRRAE